MLRFKEYIALLDMNALLEANAMHFAHIPSFDSVEHKDLVDAYNEMNLSTNDAAKIKTLADLRSKVQPGLEKIKEKAEKEAEKEKFINAAFVDGSVDKVYDNPETKVIVYKPHNARGCRAVQSGITDSACVFNYNNNAAQNDFDFYDPSGQHSYVLHLDKEKDPRYKRIVAIGTLPGKYPNDHTFVDKGNINIYDDDWERLRKEHGLDEIPALNGIRGIPIDKAHRSQELINNLTKGNFSPNEISNAKKQKYWNEKVHRPLLDARLNHLRTNLLDDIKKGKHTNNDIDLAKNFKILNESHKTALADVFADKIKAGKNDGMDILNAKKHGYLNDMHLNLLGDQLMDKMDQGKHRLDDLISADLFKYLRDDHRKKIQDPKVKEVLEKDLLDVVKKNQHTDPILEQAKENGYMNDEVKDLLASPVIKKIKKGTHTNEDLYRAYRNGYMTDDIKEHLANRLMEKIKQGTHTSYDLIDAIRYGYITEKGYHAINALANNPESTDAHAKLMYAHKEGKDKDGIDIGQAAIDAIANHPESTKAHYWLAQTHKEGRSIGQAAIDAIANNPNSTDAHTFLAQAHYEGKDIGQAAIDAISNNPESKKAHKWLKKSHKEGRSIGKDNYKKILSYGN